MSQNYDYLFSFFWGLMVFISFIGYGRAFCLIARCENKETDSWGIQSAIGIAVVISLGGGLLLLSLATKPVLVSLVVIGAISSVAFYISDRNKKSLSHKTLNFKQDFLLWIIVVILYAASVTWPGSIDATDDFQGYLAMPEKISQTGTLLEPFSLRRAYTLGGHVFLKSIVQCVTSERTGHLLDMGVCKIILFGVLTGMTHALRTSAPLLRFCFIGLVLLCPVPRINTNSSLTGVCTLLPALLLLNSYFKEENKKNLFPISILIASCITMRSLFIGPLAAACGIFAVWSWLDSKNWKSSFSLLKFNCSIWGLVAIVLLPWMVLSLLDCRTPLWPFLGGNINPAFANTGSKEGFWMDLSTSLAFMARPEVLSLLALGMLPLTLKAGRFLKAASVACSLCVFYIALKAGACLTRDVYRFTFPIMISQAIFSIGLLTACFSKCDFNESLANKNFSVKIRNAIIASLLFFGIITIPGSCVAFSESVSSIYAQLVNQGPFLPPCYRQEYLELQKKTPQGAVILATVDAPYLLDYERNNIKNADVIGGASPPPGLPLFKGPLELKKYLQNQGIEFILAVDWDKGLVSYNRKVEQETRREWFVNEVQIPNTLDFMDSIDWLEKNEKVVARGPNCRLIQLSPF